jgi:hypothetical protein
MLRCNLCGRQNVDDAKFCDGCGSPLVTGQKPEQTQTVGPIPPAPPVPPAPPPEDVGERFGREMAAAGERFGREMARAGERFGRRFEDAGRRWETRHGTRSHLLGPIIGALIAWGLLILVILGIQAARTAGGDTAYPNLGDYLGGRVLLFFGLLLLFGYVNYLHRKFHKQAVWVLPVSVAAGITIFSWLAAGALSALAIDTGRQDIADAASVGQTLLVVIFVVIVALGYLIVFTGSGWFRKSVFVPPEQGK